MKIYSEGWIKVANKLLNIVIGFAAIRSIVQAGLIMKVTIYEAPSYEVNPVFWRFLVSEAIFKVTVVTALIGLMCRWKWAFYASLSVIALDLVYRLISSKVLMAVGEEQIFLPAFAILVAVMRPNLFVPWRDVDIV